MHYLATIDNMMCRWLLTAFQPGLLPLIGKLQLQDKSLYELLINIDSKASVFLRHVFKAGNGVIPKPPSSSSSPSPSSNSRHNNHTGSSGKESSSHHHHHHKSEHRHKHSSASAHNSDTYGEERLARWAMMFCIAFCVFFYMLKLQFFLILSFKRIHKIK